MNFTSEDIKELRDKSGAGMMDCKKALDESKGSVEKAIEWLRKKGINTAQKKSSRSASDGLITVLIKGIEGIIIEVNSETDFVARNEKFQIFCNNIGNTCLENKILDIQNLPEININDSDLKVKDYLTETISMLGENIVIKKVKYLGDENFYLQKYLHNSVNENSGKIGILISYSVDKNTQEVQDFSKNICMHIAATDPKSIDIENLDKKLIDKERSIYSDQLKSSNKPENIIEKIVEGKINKFYEEVCLIEQYFVMDSKIKIKDIIKNFNSESGLNFQINKFLIFKLGQE
mgnify:CR=1 FL=1